MLSVSKKLKIAVKLSDVPSYEIARQANLDPSTLSKLICGIANIKPQDHRVLAIGQVLGIPPEECFQEDQQ
jgi:transcriptional regulator with XRE-family HTH domain